MGKNEVLALVGIGCLIAILSIPLYALVLMLTWNAIIPDLLGLMRLDYWQALWFMIVVRVLLPSHISPQKTT